MWKVKSNRSIWPDLLLIVVLSLLPDLFFWRLITSNPADRMQIASGDFTEQYFPLRAFTAQQWVNGQIPLWNPYLYGGQPALADIQSGALYPPHIIQALILGWGSPLFGHEIGFPMKALEWQVVFHFSLAAVGTYLFARHLILYRGRSRNRWSLSLRQARFGGVIASLVFTYSGYLTSFPIQQMTILSVSAWLPWVLWGLSTALARPFQTALRPIAWASLAFSLAILAGHPQTVLYIFYLILAYTVFRAFYRYRLGIKGEAKAEAEAEIPTQLDVISRLQVEKSLINYDEKQGKLPSAYKYIAKNLGVWLTIILLGTSIAAIQLLPTLEFIGLSLRADLSYEAVSAGLPLTELVSILYPGFLGGSPEYVGIAPLVLIAVALLLARSCGEVYFWTGMGLVSLLLSFGGNLFVYPLFYLLAPGFEAVRQQERVFLIYSFSAAILAGFGAAVLVGSLPKVGRVVLIHFEQRLRQMGLVAVILTAFYIYGSTAATARGDEVNLFFGVLRHHIFGLLILGGMLLLLKLRSRRWLRRPWGMALMVLLVAYNLFTVNWRFNLQPPQTSAPFAPNSTTQFLREHLDPLGRVASGGLLPGGNSAASVHNLQDLTGNTPLQLASVDNFLRQMPAWRMWQLMNVRYVIDERDIGDGGLTIAFEGDKLKTYQMGDPFEQAWLVDQIEIRTNLTSTIERLAADEFDLHRTAIVPEPLNIISNDNTTHPVEIINFSPNALSLRTETSTPQLLVVSQIYYPGWQATVDDQPVELLLVNGVLQGVVVPAGMHVVHLEFWPQTFILGVLVSIVGLIVCVGMLLRNDN